MKMMIAAAALSLVAGAAVAGEGQGNPYPYAAPTTPYSLQGYKQAANASQNPYPFLTPGTPLNAEAILQPVGSAAEVQSANSLPGSLDTPVDSTPTLAHVAGQTAPRG